MGIVKSIGLWCTFSVRGDAHGENDGQGEIYSPYYRRCVGNEIDKDGGTLPSALIVHQQKVGACSGKLPQLIGEAARAEQHVPKLTTRLLPGDALRLLLQIAQDTQAHRLLPELALAEDQVLPLRVERREVNLRIAVPPSPDPGEVEGPGVLSVEIPHLFPAHVLIDKGRVAGDKTLADLIQHDPAVAALNEAHIGIDEGEPEHSSVFLSDALSFIDRSYGSSDSALLFDLDKAGELLSVLGDKNARKV